MHWLLRTSNATSPVVQCEEPVCQISLWQNKTSAGQSPTIRQLGPVVVLASMQAQKNSQFLVAKTPGVQVDDFQLPKTPHGTFSDSWGVALGKGCEHTSALC